MAQSRARDLVRRIQDIVAEATGTRLESTHEQRLEKLLNGARRSGALDAEFAHRDVTILLADLRGFMSLTASHPDGKVFELLNRCFGRLSELIVGHRGAIDKFMGDAILAIFPAVRGKPGEDARRALQCAVEMQIALDEINRDGSAGVPVYMGIGVNSGRVLAGLVGSKLYSAYTVIGEDVNLAARIEAFALRGQVLVSDSTFQHCQGFASTGEPTDVQLKGKAGRVRVHEVLAIPSLGKTVPRQEIRRSPRVPVVLPLSYQLVTNKIVKPAMYAGRVLDIGYYGVLAEVESELPVRAETKLNFELPLPEGGAVHDVYARVVTSAAKGPRYQAGMEFTSLGPQANSALQHFVQMLVQ